MSRRAFLKWLFAMGVVIAIGFAGIRKFPQNFKTFPPFNFPEPKPSVDPVVLPPELTAEGTPLLTLMILSDLHINADIPEYSNRLKKALNDMLGMPYKVHSLIISGDLTDYGREKDYKELERVLKAYPLPQLAANMGNHDYYNIWFDGNGEFNRKNMPNGKTDAQSRDAFMKFMKQDQPYSEIWINGYHVILLSQEAYLEEKPEVGEGAWYSNEQLAWFKEKMAQHKDGKPVFVMIHQPLPAIGKNGGNHSLLRAIEFRKILKPYPNVFVFSGHNHQDFKNGLPHYIKETFHWFQNSSVNRVLNRNYESVERDTSQGLYVFVYKDKVLLRGRDFFNGTWIDEANWTVKLQ